MGSGCYEGAGAGALDWRGLGIRGTRMLGARKGGETLCGRGGCGVLGLSDWGGCKGARL